MPAKKAVNKYKGQTLDWLRHHMEQMQAYVDGRPIAALEDRCRTRIIKGQPVEYVVATIEKQREDIQKAIMDVAQMALSIKELEAEVEKEKLAIRGDEELTPMESGEIEE